MLCLDDVAHLTKALQTANATVVHLGLAARTANAREGDFMPLALATMSLHTTDECAHEMESR
jgi:hypothetical protein